MFYGVYYIHIFMNNRSIPLARIRALRLQTRSCRLQVRPNNCFFLILVSIKQVSSSQVSVRKAANRLPSDISCASQRTQVMFKSFFPLCIVHKFYIAEIPNLVSLLTCSHRCYSQMLLFFKDVKSKHFTLQWQIPPRVQIIYFFPCLLYKNRLYT